MAEAEELLENDNYFRWYLHFLGRLEIAEGNVSAAHTHLTESLKIFRDRSDELGILRSLLGFGWLAAKRARWERAVRLLGAEESLRKEMSWPEPPDWKTERYFIVQGAHKTLDETAFNAALAKGRVMTWEQAIEYSLS